MPTRKSWFAAQPEQLRIAMLVAVMHELTLVLRDVYTMNDKALLAETGWIISECNHRLVGYLFGVVTHGPRYPDDVIIEILFDYLGHPTLARYASDVWDRAMEKATKFSLRHAR
ncbi:MAG: hypothetical protein AB7O44_16245 [Hyphomicrobiaceae bacterium]